MPSIAELFERVLVLFCPQNAFKLQNNIINSFLICVHQQKFDAELFKIAMPCICAIAGAIPPDYVDASYSSKTEKKASVDAEGNFDPKPVDTTKYIYLFNYSF